MWADVVLEAVRVGTVRSYATKDESLAEWQIVSGMCALQFVWPPSVRVVEDTDLTELTGRKHMKLVASRKISKGQHIAAYLGRPSLSLSGGDYFMRPWGGLDLGGDIIFGVDGDPAFARIIAEGVVALTNVYRGNQLIDLESCVDILSGGRANHREEGLANCEFVCPKELIEGGEVPCLPTLLQSVTDIGEGEEVTVYYGPRYDIEDLSVWTTLSSFSALVGACRREGIDVFSTMGDYVWSAKSTFYCQAWEGGEARARSLRIVT